ncbi:hypothetical protein CRG98_011088 [Punica granatum]|uniref:Uncharacterized protein n=2 Tax=Punica granatum TaxID=22663 RepID=A0A2I0KJB5_PUNGR|nr:hypothetical protein CRG98_011088 [Punica granatum]
MVSTAPKAVIEGRAVARKIARNAEMETSVQSVAVKVAGNAVNNSGEAACNVAANIPVEEEKGREVSRDLNRDKNVVYTKGESLKGDNKKFKVKGSRARAREKMVHKFAKDHDIGAFAIIETRVKENNCKRIVDKWKGWYLVENYQYASNGRLWIMVQEGTPVAMLYKKLRNLKRHLKDFNRTKFGDVHAKVAELQTQPAQVQASILESDCVPSEIIKKEIDLRVELLEAIDKKEKL